MLRGSSEDIGEEQMSAAAYGIGAFFSACRVSMEHISKRNVVLHPHPLQTYGSSSIEILCQILLDDDDRYGTSVSGIHKPNSNLKVAVLKAFESVLQCTPLGVLTEEHVISIRSTVMKLADDSLDVNANESNDEAMSECSDTCARIVGAIVGLAMRNKCNSTSVSVDKGDDVNGADSEKEKGSTESSLLLSDSEMASFVEETLMPKIFTSALVSSNSKSKRYDWMVLSHACEAGQQHVSEIIVSKLVSSLEVAIRNSPSNDTNTDACTVAMALSRVIQQGGPCPQTAFHSLTSPQKTSMDIVEALTSPTRAGSPSLLALPDTRDRHKCMADDAITFAYSILTHILPSFHGTVPFENQKKIISFAGQLLPPLSNWDCVKLCVVLPILSIILDNNQVEGYEVLSESLVTMAPHLAEFALNRDQDNSARAAAASCMFSIGAKFQANNNVCLCLHLLRNTICPQIVRCANEIVAANMDTSFAYFEDAVKLCALMGSASACNGKVSSKTAVEVARFLVVMSCEGAATAPSLGISSPLHIREESNSTDEMDMLPMITASALGSMFTIEYESPFWRQRLAHTVLPVILPPINGNGNREMLNSEPVLYSLLVTWLVAYR